VRTVAGTVLDAIEQVSGERPALSAAGRTDAGAHAHAQVVGLELRRDWEPATLRAALNAVLPADVAVVDVERSAPSFNARRDAVLRTYRYVVAVREPRTPVLRRHAWHVRGPLDLDALRAAAASLEGTHDFRAFGSATRPGGSTTRTVDRVTIEVSPATDDGAPRAAQLVVISVRANAFLRGMMRAFAGALVAVGQGRRPASWVADLVRDGVVQSGSLTVAPARGLHQWAVSYAASDSEVRAA
jgi:tRNA pseudouridine38-40 synthase